MWAWAAVVTTSIRYRSYWNWHVPFVRRDPRSYDRCLDNAWPGKHWRCSDWYWSRNAGESCVLHFTNHQIVHTALVQTDDLIDSDALLDTVVSNLVNDDCWAHTVLGQMNDVVERNSLRVIDGPLVSDLLLELVFLVA